MKSAEEHHARCANCTHTSIYEGCPKHPKFSTQTQKKTQQIQKPLNPNTMNYLQAAKKNIKTQNNISQPTITQDKLQAAVQNINQFVNHMLKISTQLSRTFTIFTVL